MKIVLDQDNTITIPDYSSAGFTLVFDGGPSVLLTSVTPISQGDDGNNTLNGTLNTDYLYGNGGNDKLNGNNGDDFLYGGTGNDDLDGHYGNDWLEGGAGDDLMTGGPDNDIYVFTSGHDEIYDTSGADELRLIAGWTAEDLTFSRHVADLHDLLITINAGNSIQITNQFYGNNQVETLRFADNSTMDLMTMEFVTYGNNSNNSISGIGSGASTNDVIYGYGGNDTISTSNGNDIIYGGDGDDDIDGGNDNDFLYGEDGNDELAGASGNDWLEGGVGNDYMAGGNGNDIYIYTSGHDEIYELSGDDELRLVDGWTMGNFTFNRNFGALNDLMINIDGSNSILITNQFYGSDNIERFRFADNSTVNLTSIEVTTHGNSSNNSISGILNGASANDTIYGYGGNDTLSGGAGNDKLYGGDGNDTLTGGDGADLLDGGVGDDSLTGGTGDDTFVYTAGIDTVADSGGADTLRMGSGIDVNAITFSNVSTNHTKITVTASTDEVTINNLRHGTVANHVDFIEFADGFRTSLPDYASWVHGTASNDLIAYTSADETILAKDGNDTVQAGGGHDDVHGGTGNDVLYGEAGNDLLHGGEGNDTLYGGDGLDTLFGGAGDDIFVFETASAFNNVDVIKDFNLTDDAIDISDLLSSYDPLNDLLADWVEMTTSGTDTILSIDRDGIGGTYSMTQIATIQGVTGLTDEAALVTNGNLIVT